jgi:hypothetical protein
LLGAPTPEPKERSQPRREAIRSMGTSASR